MISVIELLSGRRRPAKAFVIAPDIWGTNDARAHDSRRALPRANATVGRRRRVFVCHPFGADPEANTAAVRKICRALVLGGELPVAPHLYLPQFLDEGTEREVAMSLSADLLAVCDEVRVYGSQITSGMRREIACAASLGIPVRIVGADS